MAIFNSKLSVYQRVSGHLEGCTPFSERPIGRRVRKHRSAHIFIPSNRNQFKYNGSQDNVNVI